MIPSSHQITHQSFTMWSLMDQVWNWNINNKYNPVNLIYKILRDNHENAPNTISLKTSVCDKEESLSSVLEKRAENGCSSTVSTGYRHPSPREALTPARVAQQHSLHMPETHRPPPTMFIRCKLRLPFSWIGRRQCCLVATWVPPLVRTSVLSSAARPVCCFIS